MLCFRQIVAVMLVFIWWSIQKMQLYYDYFVSNTRKLDHIVDNIYLGNWYDSISPERLKQSNIKRILTLNRENKHTDIELSMFRKLGIQYKYITIDDSKYSNILSHIDESLKFIRIDGDNILIHCSAGISRSVSIVIAYLIKYKNMTVDQALNFIREKRSIANPNIGFISQLKSL